MTHGKIFAQTALVIIFLATLALFFLGTILSEKTDISQQEKRQLAEFPKLLFDKSSLMDWPKLVTEYVKDHFVYREDLVLLNALMRVKLFERSPTFMVLAGEGGWYFYTGDWALHDFLRKPEKTDLELTRSWEKLITYRQKMFQGIGANYLVVIAPNKECLYPEFLPERIKSKAGTPILEVMNERMRGGPMQDHFLDLKGPLQQAKLGGPLYFKTDSHWNSRGAYFAYLAIIEKIRHWYPETLPLAEERFNKSPPENLMRADLVQIMGLHGAISEKTEEWTSQHPCAKPEDRTITSKTLPLGQSLKANGCPEGVPLRVLVISDSFGEGLNLYISETFQDVVYSRELNVYDLMSFIAEYRFDLVLDLHVGRFLRKVMSPGPGEEWQ